jgi:hypothetical protein
VPDSNSTGGSWRPREPKLEEVPKARAVTVNVTLRLTVKIALCGFKGTLTTGESKDGVKMVYPVGFTPGPDGNLGQAPMFARKPGNVRKSILHEWAHVAIWILWYKKHIKEYAEALGVPPELPADYLAGEQIKRTGEIDSTTWGSVPPWDGNCRFSGLGECTTRIGIEKDRVRDSYAVLDAWSKKPHGRRPEPDTGDDCGTAEVPMVGVPTPEEFNEAIEDLKRRIAEAAGAGR